MAYFFHGQIAAMRLLPRGTAVHACKFLLIIQTGHAPDDLLPQVGDISEWYARALAPLDLPAHTAIRVLRPFLGEALPPVHQVAAAVITGSWAMVSDREDWSERTAGWIREAMAVSLPLLGVCYGHQLMAHALGGEVDYHPQGVEIGVHPVTLSDEGQADAFFGRLPAVFDAPLTHMQTVLALPPGAVRLASSAHDAHQAVRYGPQAISVQFHPEFDAPLLRACILRRAQQLAEQGRDVPALLAGLSETPQARGILLDFVGEALAPARMAA
jgi:GMP synthase (glutamine-hydrolysing)